ncbi:FtsX-like permease family protein [Brevibacterium sp.]|uniref:FtsX-like permease family protein n=1 Tax=Brevibacterium sp. TaxID=1701 RepID=UPI0025BA06A6|nr:FtsX-like permease family protein [Brevibacterium sp.]
MNPYAVFLLIRPSRSSVLLARLQLLASGTTTLLAFAVAMLAAAFRNVPTEEIGYTVLAVSLVGLLIVPLLTLGSATVRLAARSRDDRLATLRLLGATAGQVRRVAVAEVTAIAAAGVLLGTALAAALPFLLSLLTIYGQPLRAEDLWLPWWVTTALPVVLVMVAAISGLFGLRRVVLSPLGVRMRQDAPTLSRLRFVAALVVLAGAVLVMQNISPGWGAVVITAAVAASVLGIMAMLGVAGPFVLALFSRRCARRTEDAARLLAARGVLEDPQAAWRSVSALALASFVLIPAGSMLGFLETIQAGESREIMTADQLLLFSDARIMVIALAAISFLVVACQVAITQTAAVIERRDLYVACDRIGMPVAEMDRARRLRVTMLAAVAVLGAAGAAIALAFWLVVAAAVTAPLFIATTVLILLLGLLLVHGGVVSTRPVLRRVLATPARGE